MTTATITRTNIESASYNNILSFLDNRSYVTDPKDRGGYHKRVFIYDTDPLMKSNTVGELPYIIAEYPSIEYSKTSVNGKVKEVTWTMNITVRTAREGTGGGNVGQGRQDMFDICDTLQSLFNNTTRIGEMHTLNIFFPKLTKTDTGNIIVEEKYLLQNNYTLSFMTRMEVSD